MEKKILAKNLVERVPRFAREDVRRLAEILLAASLGDFRAELTERDIEVLDAVTEEASLAMILIPTPEAMDSQRSPDGYGVQDWDQQ